MSEWSPPPAPVASSPSNPARNPYAPPSAQLAVGAIAPENAEAIRREHLSTEASIRSVGLLYGIGAVFAALGTTSVLVIAVLGLVDGTDPTGSAVLLGFSVLYGGISWIYYYLAKGLRALDPKVRTLATVFAVLGLIAFPLGTLIGLYILYYLYSEKGKRVMTAEYRAVVAQTPHIRYKTSPWIILFVVAIVVVVVLAFVMAV